MRTLFGPSIHSSAPTPDAVHKSNPLELRFTSARTDTISSSYTASSPSPREGDIWLTDSHQSQRRLAVDPSVYPSHEAEQKTWRNGDPSQRGVPKVLLMGLGRCGKSSIQHVILKTKSAGETLYLEPTNTIVESTAIESFIKLECVEVPSMLPFMSPGYNHEAIFSLAGSIVWVIDIQDENIHSIHKLVSTALWLMNNYPRINFEVFVHKTDGLSDEYKNNTFRDVRQNIQDELNDRGYGNRGLTFHQTSIYDASIHEAISKVVQRLLPQLPAIETLLTKLCSKCSMQKVYLFDTMSRIYLATDASPTFLRDFEVCSEYVDMIVDAKNIYGWRGNGSQESANRRRGVRRPQKAPTRAGRHDMNTLSDQEDDEGYNDRYYESNDDFDDDSPTKVDSFQHNRVASSDPDFYDAESSDDHAGELSGTNTISEAVGESSITLPGSQNLYMISREINDYLSLICIMGPGSTPNRRVLIDFNVGLAADAIKAIFKMA